MARSTINPPKPDSTAYQTILNPKRPSNPYAPTDEPDWVTIPRSESRLSSFSSISTSPYEHVSPSMMLSASASSSGPRKLPPPFDPSLAPVKIGRMQINEELATIQAEGPPPPPPPRRQTGLASGASAFAAAQQPRIIAKKPHPAPRHTDSSVSLPSSQTSKPKGPPPVAKKPAHLAAPASPASSTSNGFVSEASAQRDSPRPRQPSPGGPALPRRSATFALETVLNRNGPSPPLPSREKATVQPPRRAVSSANVARAGREVPRKPVPGTPKPSVAPAPPAPRRSQAVDLLDDDGHAEVGGWEALKPS